MKTALHPVHQNSPVLLCLLFGLALPSLTAAGPNNPPAPAPSRAPLPVNAVEPAREPGRPTDWKDPDKVLAQVNYDELPITEVGRNLLDQFGGEFDILYPNGPGLPGKNWSDISVMLRLKNVKASEIFNAMNMAFETGNTPLHWDLTMNGHRPTAVLRLIYPNNPEPTGMIDPSTGLPIARPVVAPDKPMVFFVSDLLGDPKTPGMTMEQIVDTVSDVYQTANKRPGNIAVHKDAQLLIVRGSDEDFRFIQSILVSLRDKMRLDAQHKAMAGEAQDEHAGKKPETISH